MEIIASRRGAHIENVLSFLLWTERPADSKLGKMYVSEQLVDQK